MSDRRRGALLVIAAAVLWSLGGVGVKIATDTEPLVVAGLRSTFALAFMLVIIAAQRVSLKRVGALLQRPLLWAAASSYALMVLMFVLSARRTTAANAIFIQYMGPIYVALLSGPMLGEKPSRRDLAIAGLCVFGMALTFGGELEGGKLTGNLLAILSGFGFAGLPLLLRLDQKRLDADLAPHAPLVAMSLGNALAAIVAIPAVVAHPPSSAKTLGVIGLLGTLQIGLPYVFYGIAVRKLRALESSLLATIEPVLSPIWVFFATREAPSPLAIAGGVVIVGAVALQTTLNNTRRASTE